MSPLQATAAAPPQPPQTDAAEAGAAEDGAGDIRPEDSPGSELGDVSNAEPERQPLPISSDSESSSSLDTSTGNLESPGLQEAETVLPQATEIHPVSVEDSDDSVGGTAAPSHAATAASSENPDNRREAPGGDEGRAYREQ